MRIMLVDDDEVIREGMKKIILNAGRDWEVVAEAGDGEIALQKLQDLSTVDLIITDVRMPIMDGIQLIKKVRENNEKIRIIVLSGFDDFSYVRNAFMNGALDYLLKPFQKKDLLARIEKVQEEMLSDEVIEEYSKKSKSVLIADVMDHLLKGTGEVNANDILELETLGVNIHFKYFMVLTIRADQYYKQFMDIQQYEKQLNEDVERILEQLGKNEEFEYCDYVSGQEMILLVFCNNEEQGESIANRVFSILNGNKDDINTDSLGISNIYSDTKKMRTAYQEAEDAVLARFYLGQNKQIFYKDVAEKCIDIQYDLEPMVSQIVHNLELCDYINAKKIMEQLFLDLSYSKPEKFRKYMHSLVEMLIIRVKDFENVLLLSGQDYQFQIDYLNTYRELKTFMNSLLQSTIEYIKGEKEKRSKKRIELAKVYIEENYQKPITLNDVAEYVELNASYFSNLFKAEVGINFSDYLLNIRIENAKKLLRDPKIKVYEIGNLVGYEDAVSFGRAFKKKLGMSPKEYRNSVY